MAILPYTSRSSELCIEEAIYKHGEQIKGDNEYQIKILWEYWQKFAFRAINGLIPHTNIEMLIEDWSVRPHMRAYGKRPVVPAQIGWGLYGYRMGRLAEWEARPMGPSYPIMVRWQSPSEISAITDQRLKNAGLWVRGQEHQRDAWRHLLARLRDIM